MRDEYADVMRLLWEPRARPARGPRPTLDLDRIARAGIEIADAEGLGDVSMQKVAARLGVTKMALYRYVPGKAELVALMVDAAMGPYPAGEEPDGGWREQLEDWAGRIFDVFRRHLWAIEATLGARLMGPGELSWVERAVCALDGTGLTGTERMDAAVLLVGHARGIAQQAGAAGPDGRPEDQLGPILGELLKAHGERFPGLAAAVGPPDAAEGRNQAWEFGLQRILDGLAVLIARRAA